MLGWFKKKFSKNNDEEQEQAAGVAAEEQTPDRTAGEEEQEGQFATEEPPAASETVADLDPDDAIPDQPEPESASEPIDESLFDDLFNVEDAEESSGKESLVDETDAAKSPELQDEESEEEQIPESAAEKGQREKQLPPTEQSSKSDIVDHQDSGNDDKEQPELELALDPEDDFSLDDLLTVEEAEKSVSKTTESSDVLDFLEKEGAEETFATAPQESKIDLETELEKLVDDSSSLRAQSKNKREQRSVGLGDLTAANEFESDVIVPQQKSDLVEDYSDDAFDKVALDGAQEQPVVSTPFDEVLANAEKLLESSSQTDKGQDDIVSLGQAPGEAAQEIADAESGEGVTHLDVEELEDVVVDQNTPESSDDNSENADENDVTVVDVEELEIIEGDSTHTTGQSKEPLSEELLREFFPAPPPEQEKPQRISMFQRLQERLGKTRDSFVYRLDALFLGKKVIDHELLDELEEILITADLGVATTMELLDEARSRVKRNELSDPQALKEILRDKILAYLQESDQPAELVMPESGPFVIMVVGVNGVGKTTTIGKVASKFVDSGQSVLLVAGDTFRAAAIDQLTIWGDRVGVDVVSGEPGCDPSSVVFDGLARGVKENVDVIIIDTAGRLHTSVNLMEELKKIRRVIGKKMETAPHEVLLVIDATTGQNAISQAKTFHEAVGVSGLAVTKLDGTAKGGIIANVCRELKIPVRFIGIGEQVDDLRDFDPEEFVQALFSQSEEESA